MHGAGSGGAGAGGGGYNGKKDPLEVRKKIEKQFLPKSASLKKCTEKEFQIPMKTLQTNPN